MLETLQDMQHPEVNLASPDVQTSDRSPPPCAVAPSAPPMEALRQPVPGPELLCTASNRLPKHAMLGKDGKLYDRASIAKTPAARGASDDFTMTGAIAAWREYADAPVRLVANLRAAVQCPITLEVPKEPVLAADGFSYERSDILLHFQTRGDKARSPITNKLFKHQRLVPNSNLTRLIAAQGLAEPDTGAGGRRVGATLLHPSTFGRATGHGNGCIAPARLRHGARLPREAVRMGSDYRVQQARHRTDCSQSLRAPHPRAAVRDTA